MVAVVLATSSWQTSVCGMAAFGQCGLGGAIRRHQGVLGLPSSR